MTVIKLNQYGQVLTGREFGADVVKELLKGLHFPVCIDFIGVESIGSSFGDEVIPTLAQQQGNRIEVKNVNETVRAILMDIAMDAGIELKEIT